jgi:hypothetical protein
VSAGAERRPARGGSADLCPRCKHVKSVPGKNTVFLMCRRSQSDPRFPRYPPQPITSCVGFEPEPRAADAGGPWP